MTDRGKALNAFQYAYGILYNWQNGEWVEVARREGRSDNCEGCGVKFRSGKYPPPENDGTAYPYSVWVGKPTLRKVDVCDDCHNDILFERYDPPKINTYYVTDHRTGEKIERQQEYKWKRSRPRKVDQREL